MPIVEFTQKDILHSKLLDPGWYHVHIDAIGEKLSSQGDSKNYPVESTVVSSENGVTDDIQGVPLNWNFNSKAIGFAVGFLEAFGRKVEAGEQIELSSAEGKDLLVYVERGEYQGREVNRVPHKYRPLAA